ncbi:MAG: pyruvate kinase [Thermoflexales bacterium]|nr:pyruvate kinase [Thermoflexales bacterium]MCS7324118.1 pyruvate kinase [Thermoflexales bacterium]MDW8054328.1 pyruvate kinase [Anaerolineae bacterium]MDW8291510.1 pyruvate kinase [Anaerolineae bacterium]
MTASLERLIDQVMHLRDQALAFESANQHLLEHVAEHYRNSARNLMHYLALRQRDLRDLQNELAALGLSSLGRSESHTLHTLHGVLRALHCLAGRSVDLDDSVVPVTFRTGALLLDDHARQLFGEAAGKRPVRIMVTMPSEAARDSALVRALLAAGMDIMRINCAHDTPADWLRMIAHLREAERAVGRTCKVYADLAGPKLRTGPLPPIYVRKVRPKRNVRGEVIEPARVWFAASPEINAPDDAPLIPVEGDLVRKARKGDVIYLRDARGRARRLWVETRRKGLLGVCFDRTVYFESGAALRLRRGDAWLPVESAIGALPPQHEPLVLNIGDRLVLTRDEQPGQPARRNRSGAVIEPARIGCTLGEAFDAVQPDQHIWFDDGKIGGRVLSNDGERILVEITFTRPSGGKLGAEKGINLPDTDLSAIPALTPKDREDLALLAHHVDMVGLSFVRQPEDVTMLAEALRQLRAQHVAVVLKIETRRAFENLPRLLLTGMQMPSLGVMVARGDLAVEVGFDRLAEVQEEILWICEAAHVPVIWATQVLESMAKSGAPSRAEVSDAVMSGRAECVMLNKGPYIVEATRFLSNVLERMAAHQSKKRSRLRRLSIAHL